MNISQKRNGGYIGLISLLIAVTIGIVFLVMMLQNSVGGSPQSTLKTEKAAIEQAEEVKALLEKQNGTISP